MHFLQYWTPARKSKLGKQKWRAGAVWWLTVHPVTDRVHPVTDSLTPLMVHLFCGFKFGHKIFYLLLSLNSLVLKLVFALISLGQPKVRVPGTNSPSIYKNFSACVSDWLIAGLWIRIQWLCGSRIRIRWQVSEVKTINVSTVHFFQFY
jgi:hypothetical protein